MLVDRDQETKLMTTRSQRRKRLVQLRPRQRRSHLLLGSPMGGQQGALLSHNCRAD